MSGIILEVLILFLLVLINGIFVMSEMAVVSSRKARLQQLANLGDKRAAAALELAQNPTTFLSTVQIGITLVSVLLGAVGGPALSAPLAALFQRWPAIGPYANTLALGIVVVLITSISPWWQASLSPNAWRYINRKEWQQPSRAQCPRSQNYSPLWFGSWDALQNLP